MDRGGKDPELAGYPELKREVKYGKEKEQNRRLFERKGQLPALLRRGQKRHHACR